MKKNILIVFSLLLSITAFSQTKEFAQSLKLSDYKPRSVFKLQEDGIKQAAYPVIDMHSHAYVNTVEELQQWVKDMDANNIEKVVDAMTAQGIV